jgi:succinyl-CoA synthetase beta subunit
MNIHEYQAKILLSQYNLNVPRGLLAETVQETVTAADELGGTGWVLKAQVHAGGRGKAGGIKLVRDKNKIAETAQSMFGMILKTKQTGDEGKLVRKLYVEETKNIVKELYLSLVLDRVNAAVSIIASAEGGMDIEEVAENHPDKIITATVDPTIGLYDFHIRNLAYGIGIEKDLMGKFAAVVRGLYNMFIEKNANQIEINPLIITAEGEFFILDAKCDFDDNALFKHKDIAAMEDEHESSPLEVQATKAGLNYVKMQGNIACMVNGAGLAMATMDLIHLHGGEPANFLDVGGTADAERVTKAMHIIASDTDVKGVFINIMGGIVRCDLIAQGVIDASRDLKRELPVVLRMDGTNAEKADKMLKESGIKFFATNDLEEAVKQVIEFSL